MSIPTNDNLDRMRDILADDDTCRITPGAAYDHRSALSGMVLEMRGEHIKDLIYQKSKSLRAFASSCGFSYDTLLRAVGHGTNRLPSLYTAAVIAKRLGVPITDLYVVISTRSTH